MSMGLSKPPTPTNSDTTERAPNNDAADQAGDPRLRTVIEPPQGWQFINFGELWRYRELLLFLCWRDVKVRYKQTALGAAWAILQPAMMMAVFMVFFGRLAGVSTGEVPQSLFFLSGILPWFFFSTALTNAANSVVGSERLITRIYFPRLAIPFATVAAAAVDFAVACGLLAAMAVGYSVAGYTIAPGWSILMAPVAIGLVALTAAGLGAFLAALNVAYRDFRYVVPFFIQLGMFATPAIYMRPTAEQGDAVALLRALNPMNSLIETFRAGVLGGPVPWGRLGVAAALAVVVFLVGCLYFRKVEERFADIV